MKSVTVKPWVSPFYSPSFPVFPVSIWGYYVLGGAPSFLPHAVTLTIWCSKSTSDRKEGHEKWQFPFYFLLHLVIASVHRDSLLGG